MADTLRTRKPVRQAPVLLTEREARQFDQDRPFGFNVNMGRLRRETKGREIWVDCISRIR